LIQLFDFRRVDFCRQDTASIISNELREIPHRMSEGPWNYFPQDRQFSPKVEDNRGRKRLSTMPRLHAVSDMEEFLRVCSSSSVISSSAVLMEQGTHQSIKLLRNSWQNRMKCNVLRISVSSLEQPAAGGCLLQRSSKTQSPNQARVRWWPSRRRVEVGGLEFLWSFELGIWSFPAESLLRKQGGTPSFFL